MIDLNERSQIFEGINERLMGFGGFCTFERIGGVFIGSLIFFGRLVVDVFISGSRLYRFGWERRLIVSIVNVVIVPRVDR